MRLADEQAPLAAADLWLLALAAGLTGRDAELLRAHERAYTLHLDAGQLTEGQHGMEPPGRALAGS